MRAPARLGILLAAALLGTAAGASESAAERTAWLESAPDVLWITVDTLRADHLSVAGYPRQTTPQIDRLLGAGTRFAVARALEPLTNPSLTSLLSSLPPHRHGATRNGIPARPDLETLPDLLERRGYATAAILGNWTLRDRNSGLARHFETFRVIESRKRWFGLAKAEAVAADLTRAAAAWLEERRETSQRRPSFLWVHYVEPHAPYRLHAEFAGRLGIDPRRARDLDRYDTEIAAVDAEIGHLLRHWGARGSAREALIVFAADHGEAFGEDGVHGHGRVLHEASLRVPLGFVWTGRVPAATSGIPVSLLDVAPTVLGLLGLTPHPAFAGTDLSADLLEGARRIPPPPCFQAHRGAVQSRDRAERARRRGLLQVAAISGDALEVVAVGTGERRSLPLARGVTLAPAPAAAGPTVDSCLGEIRAALDHPDLEAPPELDAESAERLRSLGYLD